MSKRVLSDECMTTFKYPKEDASGRRSPSGWDGTMKSLLNEALARHQEAEAKEEREAARAAKSQEKAKNGDDQEIEKIDRKSTRLNSSHVSISYAVFR